MRDFTVLDSPHVDLLRDFTLLDSPNVATIKQTN